MSNRLAAILLGTAMLIPLCTIIAFHVSTVVLWLVIKYVGLLSSILLAFTGCVFIFAGVTGE